MKKLKKLTSLLLALLMILNTFLPITVLALNIENGIILTFSVTGDHTVSEQDGHLVIDNNYVDPKNLTTEYYLVECNNNICTMSIDNTISSVSLNISENDVFSLSAGEQVVNNNTVFTESTNISVENPISNEQSEQEYSYDENELSLTITLNMSNNAPENFIFQTNGNNTEISVTDGENSSFIGLDDNAHEPVLQQDTYVTVSNDKKSATIKVYNNNDGIFMVTSGDSIFQIDGYSGAYEIIRNDGSYTISEWIHEAPFDGNVILVWQCAQNACKKQINLENPETMTYILDSTISDGTNTFNVNTALENLDKVGFVLPSDLDEWEADYKTINNLSDEQYDFKNIDVGLLLNGRMQEIQRVWEENGTCSYTDVPGEFEQCVDQHANPTIVDKGLNRLSNGQTVGNNSITSFGDNMFKVTLYGSDYAAIKEDTTNLKYQIDRFETMYSDSTDISGSTKENPIVLETLLMEGKTVISSNGVAGVVFKSVKPLDTPRGAIDVEEISTGKFEITFNSNFYDRTIFEITDINNNKYYVRIVRSAISISIHNGDPIINKTNAYIEVKLYFDKDTSWEDYEVNATIVHQDGSFEKTTLENLKAIDIGGGNVYYVYEKEDGINLKLASFGLDLIGDEEYLDSIQGIYVNVRKSGTTEETYAGTYAGNGRGIYINGEEEYPFIDYTK